MAHVLKGYDGPCKNIHGHSYELLVTLSGSPIDDEKSPKYGMIMDFKDLKTLIKSNVIDRYDHALLISKKHDREVIDALRKNFEKVVITPFQPTSENLVNEIAQTIIPLLPENISLHNLRLRETATAFAEWFAEDNK